MSVIVEDKTLDLNNNYVIVKNSKVNGKTYFYRGKGYQKTSSKAKDAKIFLSLTGAKKELSELPDGPGFYIEKVNKYFIYSDFWICGYNLNVKIRSESRTISNAVKSHKKQPIKTKEELFEKLNNSIKKQIYNVDSDVEFYEERLKNLKSKKECLEGIDVEKYINTKVSTEQDILALLYNKKETE